MLNRIAFVFEVGRTRTKVFLAKINNNNNSLTSPT